MTCVRSVEVASSPAPRRGRLEPGSRGSQETTPSSNQGSWPWYRSVRLLAMGRPLDEAEQAALPGAAMALQRCLALEPMSAAHQARRCLLMRREQLLHEVLMVELAPHRLAQLLDALVVEGLEHVIGLGGDEPVLLMSLHYSLHSSLLWLWLAREAARGLFSHLTFLFDRGPNGYLWVPPGRQEEMEAVSLGRREVLTLLDKRMMGSRAAAHRLLERLRRGGAALVLPDASFLPDKEGRTLPIALGRRTVAFPRGVAWLAGAVRCPVVPVHIQPRGETHAIVFGPPTFPNSDCDPQRAVQSTIQGLLERTVLADPGPWERWLFFPAGADSVAAVDPWKRGNGV